MWRILRAAGRELRIPLADPKQNEKIEKFEYKGYRITNFEMESSALAGLKITLEAYPDLKANQNFLQLQGEISDIENKLAAVRVTLTLLPENSITLYRLSRPILSLECLVSTKK